MEHKDQPEFRQLTYISAYGEGLGAVLRAARREMGMYDTPYDRFGMLGYQIWRAARLVVDTGMHRRAGRAHQAHRLPARSTPRCPSTRSRPRSTATSPGRARRCRTTWASAPSSRRARKAEKALGEHFDIRAFHDACWQLGSVPLPVLQARIDRFIADQGRGPYPDME